MISMTTTNDITTVSMVTDVSTKSTNTKRRRQEATSLEAMLVIKHLQAIIAVITLLANEVVAVAAHTRPQVQLN